MIDRSALAEPPEALHELIALAWSHMDDQPLLDACHGGSGPLADHQELEYTEYLQILGQMEIEQATLKAKREHSQGRRREFGGRRSELVLAMIEDGFPYVCAVPGCDESEDLTVDHITPLSRGGSDDLPNLQFMCRRHNSSKSDK